MTDKERTEPEIDIDKPEKAGFSMEDAVKLIIWAILIYGAYRLLFVGNSEE